MTILVYEKWIVKPEKQEEHTQLMQTFRKYIEDTPEMSNKVKSIKECSQMLGGTSGMFIWLIEFDSLADYEKAELHMLTDEEGAKLYQEWYTLIDSTTVSIEVWRVQ